MTELEKLNAAATRDYALADYLERAARLVSEWSISFEMPQPVPGIALKMFGEHVKMAEAIRDLIPSACLRASVIDDAMVERPPERPHSMSTDKHLIKQAATIAAALFREDAANYADRAQRDHRHLVADRMLEGDGDHLLEVKIALAALCSREVDEAMIERAQNAYYRSRVMWAESRSEALKASMRAALEAALGARNDPR